MDSFEINKIAGAILGTLLFVMGAGFLAEAIYHPIEDRGHGYALPEPEVAEAGAPAEAPATIPLGTLLASANPTAGAASARKCQGCHDFTDGGPNKVGPNLYDVVDRPIGSHPGFSYSAGMQEHLARGDIWSFENLDAFLTAPKAFTPGTKMSFSGVKDPVERANILAYLQTLSASPKPFPAPEVSPPADATPAQQPAAEPTTPSPEGTPAAPSTDAVQTPSTTQSETPVEGTPAEGNTPEAAPAPQAPAQTPTVTTPAAPATPPAAPATETAPAPTTTPAAPAGNQMAPAAPAAQ